VTAALAELQAVIRGRVSLDEPMARHTTFRVGGPADAFVNPSDLDDLRTLLRWLAERGVPATVIGNGSNLVVSDRGIRGAVISLRPGFRDVEFLPDGVRVGAGASLPRLVHVAAEAGYTGLESTVGIPGSIGGALATNAGTDSGHFGELVAEATVMNRQGEVRVHAAEELNYRYRFSSLLNSEYLVLEARLRLAVADRDQIRAKMDRLGAKRSSRQPLRAWSAGCVFKNPAEIGLAAGKLLDRAGAKGRRRGDAQVSCKHANFIINQGRAQADDIRALIDEMEALVRRTYGVELEREIQLVGEW
jgi:UDP-N-acetylmuramate dehydrogenase